MRALHPIPPGTRDVLPEEMRELRELEAALLDIFDRHGYGHVETPSIEYDEVIARGEGTRDGGYRFFDEQGQLVGLRTDMTVPIARLVSTRFAGEDPPFRLCYSARAHRMIRPQQGQMREFVQVGVELIGVDAPEGTAEMLTVLSESLDAAGLPRARIGLGDADLYRALLTELGVDPDARDRILDGLVRHDFVGLEADVDQLGLGSAERDALLRVPQLRGGTDVLEQAAALGVGAVNTATARIQATLDALRDRGISDRVIVDLGLVRDLGYYTGAIVEVYDPAIGHVIGGGGRYDDLLGRFGRDLPAAGFSLYLERVHVAKAEEERIASELEPGGPS